MFMKLGKISLALALGLGTLASTSLPVSSMPVTVGQQSGTDNVMTVDYNQNHRMNHQWSRSRDGNRCKVAYGNCRHFYRGYYYETPWWTLPFIIGGAIANDNGYDRHHSRAAWCRATNPSMASALPRRQL